MARMTKSQREELERCTATCVGRPVSFKYKGKSERFLVGQVEDVVSTIVADYNHMIQRIKLSPKTARDWCGSTTYTAPVTTRSPTKRESPYLDNMPHSFPMWIFTYSPQGKQKRDGWVCLRWIIY